MRDREWCPWQGCLRLRSDDPRQWDEHVATLHRRCRCGRYVVSVTGHIAQMRRRGLTHVDPLNANGSAHLAALSSHTEKDER